MSRLKIIVLAVVVLVLIFVGGYYYFIMRGNSAPAGGQMSLPTQTITVGTASVIAEIATTDTERQDGLSNRSGLAAGHGMLFVFPKDGDWGIWMPHMQFSIDIIWTDAAGKIIALDANISPQTYPTVFYPNNNARYVLEVPAGWTSQHSITVGTNMSLPH